MSEPYRPPVEIELGPEISLYIYPDYLSLFVAEAGPHEEGEYPSHATLDFAEAEQLAIALIQATAGSIERPFENEDPTLSVEDGIVSIVDDRARYRLSKDDALKLGLALIRAAKEAK